MHFETHQTTLDGKLRPHTQPPKPSLLLRLLPRNFLQDFRHCCVSLYTVLCFIIISDTVKQFKHVSMQQEFRCSLAAWPKSYFESVHCKINFLQQESNKKVTLSCVTKTINIVTRVQWDKMGNPWQAPYPLTLMSWVYLLNLYTFELDL